MYIGEFSLMEKVQNKFTKMLGQGSVLSHTERNVALGISAHEMRRVRGELLCMYRLLDDLKKFSEIQALTKEKTQ